jgi:hypothetical protein
VVGISSFLCKSANALGIPVIVTEQEPFKPTGSLVAPTPACAVTDCACAVLLSVRQ